MGIRTWVRGPSNTLVDISDRIAFGMSFQERAEEGSTAVNTVVIDDPLADFIPHGHRLIAFEETLAETSTDRFFGIGYLGECRIIRGPYRTGVSRQWECDVSDVNSVLSRRVMIGGGNERPEEEDYTRVIWAEQTNEGGLIDDTRYLSSADGKTMDKTDYLLGDSISVYDDCAQQSGKNYFLTYFGDVGVDGSNPWGYFSLWYDFTDSTEYRGAAKLSNIAAEVDFTTTFPLYIEDTFRVDPMRIYSRVIVPYKDSYVSANREATKAAYAHRDKVMPAPRVKTKARAQKRANRYVAALATPDYRATVHTLVTRAKVNAFRPGMAVQVKATHWIEPFATTFTYMRILTRRVTEVSTDDGAAYELELELSYGESAQVDAIGCEADLTPTATYPSLGSFTSDATGNVMYLRSGITQPQVPTPGFVGSWHFPAFGAGTDFAGDCTGSFVRFVVGGDGQARINTAAYTSGRTLTATLNHYDGGIITDHTISGVAAGSTITFDVSTHGGAQCYHWIDVVDDGTSCGSKWGFVSADWTLAP